MKDELKAIKKEFQTPRRTIIQDEITEIKIDELSMVSKEDYIVSVTKSGYVKKMSLKSYNSSTDSAFGLKEGDYCIGLYKINNIDTLILITNLGNYCYLPIRDITETKYKEIGKHISSYISISEGESIVASFGIKTFDERTITLFSKNGMVKRTKLNALPVSRYSKPMVIFKLKEDDTIISASINEGDVYIITKNGYALKFNKEEIPVVGPKTSGVKGIKLISDEVSSGFITNETHEYITLFTSQNTAKRIKLNEIEFSKRSLKGENILKSPKTKKYDIIKSYAGSSKTNYGLVQDETRLIKSSDINIMEKTSTGSVIDKESISNIFKEARLKIIDETEEHLDKPKEDVFLEEPKEETIVDNKNKSFETMTMSDFFDEFKI